MGTPPYTYNWDNGLGAGQNHNVSPISTTTYSVTVTDFNLCTSTDNVIVTVNPKPVVNAGMDVAICKGTSTTLMANGSMGTPPYTYNWDNGLGAGQNHNVSPISTTTYSVTVTDFNLCTSTDNVIVTVNPKPVVNAGMDVAICKGTSTTLMANGSMGTPPYTYNWDNGLGAGQNHNVSPISTTTYSVTVTDFNLCTSTDNVIVTVNPKPVVNAGMDVAICKGTSTTLMANGSMGTPPYTYNWDNGLGAGQNHNVSPISTTTYSVTVTDFNLCTSTDNVIVTVNPKPVVNAGMDVAICKGTSTTLMANGSMGNPPYTYNWDNGLGAGQNHNVSPISTTTYSVTATDFNLCMSSDTITVNVLDIPKAGKIDGDNFVCKGAMNFLSISGNSIPGGWSSNNTNVVTVDNSGKVMGQSAGSAVIKYTVVSSSGCKDSVQKDINVPFVNAGLISGPDQVCKQADISLKINGNSSQGLWSSDNTNVATVDNFGKVFGVNVGQAKIKYLVIGLNGCKDSVIQVMKINEKPSAGLISGANMLCKGSMIILTITGNSILGGWSSNDLSVLVVNAQGQVTGLKQGKTSVKYLVVSSEGCKDSFLKDITVNPLPNPGSISSNSGRFELCDDSSLDLTSNGDLNGKWSSSKLSIATIAQNNGKLTAISPGVSTVVYSVTNSFGCVDSTSKDFTVNSNPKVEIDGIGSICKNDTTEFIAEVMEGTPTYFYVWDKGSSLGSKRNNVSQAGIYNVSVTDSKGCKGVTSKELKLFKLPFSNFDFTPNLGNNYNIDISNQSYPTESGAVIVKYEMYIDGVKKLDSSAFKSYNHTFVTTGIHKIILKVTDSNGCMNIFEKTYKIQDLKCDDLAFKINFSSKDSTYCYRGNDSIFIDLELNESKIFQSSNGIDSFSIPRFIITNGKGGNFRDTINKVISSSGKDRFIKIPVNKLRTGKESFIVEVTVLYLNSTGGKDPLICSAELPYEIFDTVNLTLERDSFCFKDSKNLTLIKSNGNNVSELKINGQLRTDFNSVSYPFPITFGTRDSLLNILYEIKSEGGCTSKNSLKAYGFSLPPEIMDTTVCINDSVVFFKNIDTKNFEYCWSYIGKSEVCNKIMNLKVTENLIANYSFKNVRSGTLECKSDLSFNISAVESPDFILDSIACSGLYFIKNLSNSKAVLAWESTGSLSTKVIDRNKNLISVLNGRGKLIAQAKIGSCYKRDTLDVETSSLVDNRLLDSSSIKSFICGGKKLLFPSDSGLCTKWISFNEDGLIDTSFMSSLEYKVVDFDYSDNHHVFMMRFNCSDSCNGYISILNDRIKEKDSCNILSQAKMILYPNPNNGLFTIEFDGIEKGNYQIEIFNHLGQLVESDNIQITESDYKHLYSFKSFTSDGIYSLRIVNSSITKFHKNLVILK
ncbi:MAG: Ig-like domain-containing protein [Saprospiraceae bacterium]|nr:Ig-like domain-containing protein [Candidatus Vicinibacter affinis]